MVMLCFVLDLPSLSPPLLRDLKQSLLQLGNYYAISCTKYSSGCDSTRSKPLLDRIGLCYIVRDRVSCSDQLKVAYKPQGNFNLRDFHHALNSLPIDAFSPESNDNTALCKDLRLAEVLSDKIVYTWGDNDETFARKVIIISSCHVDTPDSVTMKALMDAAVRNVKVDFVFLMQMSSHLGDVTMTIKENEEQIGSLKHCSFQKYVPDVQVLFGLAKRWFLELKDALEEPVKARFIFKINLNDSLNQISCNLCPSYYPIVDEFIFCKTCRCHGLPLDHRSINLNKRSSSCPVTKDNLEDQDIVDNSVKVGEQTILHMPSFRGSQKLQLASTPIDFNVIQRTNLGSLSEGAFLEGGLSKCLYFLHACYPPCKGCYRNHSFLETCSRFNFLSFTDTGCVYLDAAFISMSGVFSFVQQRRINIDSVRFRWFSFEFIYIATLPSCMWRWHSSKKFLLRLDEVKEAFLTEIVSALTAIVDYFSEIARLHILIVVISATGTVLRFSNLAASNAIILSVWTGLITGPTYFVTPSTLHDSDDNAMSELNNQLFQVVCRVLNSLDQGLVCSSNCNIDTGTETLFHCYYILLPSDKGLMLLRRLSAAEEFLPIPDVNQQISSVVVEVVENTVQASLLKMEVSDYNPVQHARGFHQKLNLLVKESLQFGAIVPKTKEGIPESDLTKLWSSSEVQPSVLAEDIIIVGEEMPQFDSEVGEIKTAQYITEEWEQLVVTEMGGMSSTTCTPSSNPDQSVKSPSQGNRALDEKTTRILERLETPRQLKRKSVSPIISSTVVAADVCAPVKKPLIPFGRIQTAEGPASSQPMKPTFQRIKRKR